MASNQTPVNLTEKKEIKLTKENELRFEVEEKEKVTVELRSGLAEMFGTELMKGRVYSFYSGAKVAIYTWHGCVLELTGKPEVEYTAKETPMTFYLNIHGVLEQMREAAASIGDRGPVVMVVGPGDVGKSTLCRLLCNYAVRRQRTPLYIDLDVGQGAISVPGTMAMSVIERTAEVEGGFSDAGPLIYHFGSDSPGSNPNLYHLIMEKMASAMKAKFDADVKVKTSGVVINTCGWVSGLGYKALLYAAEVFEVNVVLVLDQERLYNELSRDLPKLPDSRTNKSNLDVVFVPKSGGVVVRSKEFRAHARDSKIREYFYGTPLKGVNSTFYPHSFDVPFTSLKLFKIGGPAIPLSCLPIGMKSEDSQTKVTPVTAIHQLRKHQLLSISFASVADKALASETNIQGIICVTETDVDRGMLTVLSPQPKPLPLDYVILTSDVQFLDAD